MQTLDAPDERALKVARQALQDDQSFGSSPVTSHFSNALSNPRFLFYPLFLSAVYLGGEYELYARLPLMLLLVVTCLVLTALAVARSHRGLGAKDGTDRSYRQFRLFRDRVVLLPGGLSIPFQEVESITHGLQRFALPRGATGSINEVVIRAGNRPYAFLWSGPSLPRNRTFDTDLDLLLYFLGFRADPDRQEQYAKPYDSRQGIQKVFYYEPKYAPAPELRLTPLPPDLMDRSVPPVILVLAFAGIAAVVYWVAYLVSAM